jgi:hypothetical protein
LVTKERLQLLNHMTGACSIAVMGIRSIGNGGPTVQRPFHALC